MKTKLAKIMLTLAFVVAYVSVGVVTKPEPTHKPYIPPADNICYVYPDGHMDCYTET